MGNLSTREAYGKSLAEFGKKYDFFVLDADLAKATQTLVFQKEFPNRFFNMGISEGDMMTTAAGMWKNSICKHFRNVCSRTCL